VKLLRNLGNSDEGQRHGHGLAVAHIHRCSMCRHRRCLGQGRVSARQRLGLYPPQLCRRSDSGGRGGGDQRPGHDRDRGHHGVRGHGRHEVRIHDWKTGSWISRFSVLFLLTLALTVLTKCARCQLRHFLSIKRISELTADKLWFIFVFVVKFLISF